MKSQAPGVPPGPLVLCADEVAGTGGTGVGVAAGGPPVSSAAELEAKAAAAATVDHPTWEVIEGGNVDVMATLEPGSVRLIFADPPYNQDVPYGPHHDDNMDRDDYLAWSERLC